MTENEINVLEAAASHIRNDAYNCDSILDRKYFEGLADKIENIIVKHKANNLYPKGTP
jgi:hypothetical protein